MDLRFQVSPSEAGTIIDGLHAQGITASQDNQRLGDTETHLTVRDVADGEADQVRGAVSAMDQSAVEVESR